MTSQKHPCNATRTRIRTCFFYPLLFPLKKCAIHKIHNNNVGAIFSNKARGQSFQ